MCTASTIEEPSAQGVGLHQYPVQDGARGCMWVVEDGSGNGLVLKHMGITLGVA